MTYRAPLHMISLYTWFQALNFLPLLVPICAKTCFLLVASAPFWFRLARSCTDQNRDGTRGHFLWPLLKVKRCQAIIPPIVNSLWLSSLVFGGAVPLGHCLGSIIEDKTRQIRGSGTILLENCVSNPVLFFTGWTYSPVKVELSTYASTTPKAYWFKWSKLSALP